MSEAKPRSAFPRTFWVANVMELFERAAYYGMNSVLAVYLTGEAIEGGLGFGEQSVGFLQSIVYAATYVIPILGGALADRYGYRRMLLVAFSFMAAGYFAAGYASSYALVFLALLVMATGSGLFKPIISGTIARTTDESNSAFGFGIYYWMINLGAFLAPLVVSVLKGFSWHWVFVASALYTGLMLLPTVFAYRDPPGTPGHERRAERDSLPRSERGDGGVRRSTPRDEKTLREVLVGAAEVLADARFMLMIFVYSGFWVLYFQNFGSVLWYLRDFVDGSPVSEAVTTLLARLGLPWSFHFDAEHVTVINAGTIILLQVLVSRIVKDWKPLPTMVTGMAIGAVGFLLLAASRSPWVFILGIAVFSIGEMTAHPKYYSFIGQVAPADRKAVYMGYAFLYGVLGSLLGSSLGAFLYERMLKPALGTPEADGRARAFWLLFAALDVVAAVGLVLFARAFGRDTADTRRRAHAIMRVVYGGVVLLGAVFLYLALSGPALQARVAVQAAIFVALGVGGLLVGRSRGPETA
jgi:dipeptide/tripeptide permease